MNGYAPENRDTTFVPERLGGLGRALFCFYPYLFKTEFSPSSQVLRVGTDCIQRKDAIYWYQEM
jgi:hypothetical protein